MSNFEMAVKDAVEKQRQLNADLESMQQQVEVLNKEVAMRDGRIAELNRQLTETKVFSDNYLRWATEVTQQLNNVAVTVNEAIRKASLEDDRPQSKMSEKMEGVLNRVQEEIDYPPPKDPLPSLKAKLPSWLESDQRAERSGK